MLFYLFGALPARVVDSDIEAGGFYSKEALERLATFPKWRFCWGPRTETKVECDIFYIYSVIFIIDKIKSKSLYNVARDNSTRTAPAETPSNLCCCYSNV